jgi:hypothetical protein
MCSDRKRTSLGPAQCPRSLRRRQNSGIQPSGEPRHVPVGFDGVRNRCQKIRRGCSFRHDASSVPEMTGLTARLDISRSLLMFSLERNGIRSDWRRHPAGVGRFVHSLFLVLDMYAHIIYLRTGGSCWLRFAKPEGQKQKFTCERLSLDGLVHCMASSHPNGKFRGFLSTVSRYTSSASPDPSLVVSAPSSRSAVASIEGVLLLRF